MNNGFNHKCELINLIDENQIDANKVCVTGSASLAVRNIRENEDLDLVLHPTINYTAEPPDFIDISNNHMGFMGISDRDIIEQDKYHDEFNGIKIIRPELILSHKHHYRDKERRKDFEDICHLQEYAINNPDDWDWGLVSYTADELFNSNQSTDPLLKKIYYSLMHDGVVETFKKGLDTYVFSIIREGVGAIRNFRQKYQRSPDITRYELQIPLSNLLSKQQSNHLDQILDRAARIEAIYEASDSYESKYDFLNSKRGVQEYPRNLINPQNEMECITIDPTFLENEIDPEISVAIFLRMENIKISQAKKNNMCFWKHIGGSGGHNMSSKIISNIKYKMLKKYGLIFPVILWPSVEDHWNDISRELKENKNIIVKKEYDIEIDKFGDFVREVYHYSSNPHWSTLKKIHELQSYENKIRILEMEFKCTSETTDIYKEVKYMKRRIRQSYRDEFEEYFHDIIVHMGDSYIENKHILKLIDDKVSDYE